jgi:hypothetical protein
MPPPTIGDATVAMDAVLKKYGPFLDPFVLAVVEKTDVNKIYRILPEDEYAPHFNSVFRNFFAAINAEALYARKNPDQPRTQNDPLTYQTILLARNATGATPVIACPAFTSPAVNVWDRVIYVNKDSGLTIGTLYHEFVHYLEHGNFYPEYYSLGGNNPKILEGVTEYLTREVHPNIRGERELGRKYQPFLDITLNRAWGSDKETLEKMIKVAFEGDMKSLPPP